MRRSIAACLLVVIAGSPAIAHDIPNARVDRSIQATLGPGRLRVDYEVSLAELTLAQDLRKLVGELPGADRRGWFEAYGKEVGPLNAKGLLVLVDGSEVDLTAVGFDLVVEGHPRYTFHFEADVPPSGRLSLNDSNYAASEGTSRLALRAVGGIAVRGDSLPTEVTQIPIRPVWQLSPEEERRTRRLTIDYSPSGLPSAIPPIESTARAAIAPPPSSGLSNLLDDQAGRAWPGLLLAAFVLGAAHAIQPGHGKTMVAASSIGPGGGPFRGAMLGLATATAHLSSVALIALGIWMTRFTRFGELHLALARMAGFAIAAIGLWRLGRHLGGYGEHEAVDTPGDLDFRGILALGLAGGVVPCWDAVALVVLSAAIGRLGLGLTLLAAFSLGMAVVLVAVGAAASRFRSAFGRSERRVLWERRLGMIGALILAGIGISLLR
jgi:nickel/cobalt exporter